MVASIFIDGRPPAGPGADQVGDAMKSPSKGRISADNSGPHAEFAAPFHARHLWFIQIVSDTQ
jgi:hypothetical protein